MSDFDELNEDDLEDFDEEFDDDFEEELEDEYQVDENFPGTIANPTGGPPIVETPVDKSKGAPDPKKGKEKK